MNWPRQIGGRASRTLLDINQNGQIRRRDGEDISWYMDMIFHKLTVFPMTPGTSLKTKIIAVGGGDDRNLSWSPVLFRACVIRLLKQETRRTAKGDELSKNNNNNLSSRRNGKQMYQRRKRFSRLGLTCFFYCLFSNTVWLKKNTHVSQLFVSLPCSFHRADRTYIFSTKFSFN